MQKCVETVWTLGSFNLLNHSDYMQAHNNIWFIRDGKIFFYAKGAGSPLLLRKLGANITETESRNLRRSFKPLKGTTHLMELGTAALEDTGRTPIALSLTG